jgi:hypothetical protein
MLDRLAAHAPIMKTVSLPRRRHRLHAMPISTGYEIRTESTYDWNGRQRGHTPFTVLQHTIAGAGNLLYEHQRYRLRPGDTMLLIIPHTQLLARRRRPLGVLLGLDERPGSGAHPPHDPERGRAGVALAPGNDRAPRSL